MKRLAFLTAASLLLTIFLTACGGSRGGHCDAYGSVNDLENVDLSSK